MTALEYELKEIVYPDYIHEIGRLRVEAWKETPGVNPELFSGEEWLDEKDPVSFHWGMFDNGKLIAASRLSIVDEIEKLPWLDSMMKFNPFEVLRTPVASLNRQVIKKEYRGKGLTRYIDEIRIEKARIEGAKCVIGEPVKIRINSLKKLGFEYLGQFDPTYELPGVELGFMVLYL